jgi:hypothetical protein
MSTSREEAWMKRGDVVIFRQELVDGVACCFGKNAGRAAGGDLQISLFLRDFDGNCGQKGGRWGIVVATNIFGLHPRV